jgi:hypothetical protein
LKNALLCSPGANDGAGVPEGCMSKNGWVVFGVVVVAVLVVLSRYAFPLH